MVRSRFTTSRWWSTASRWRLKSARAKKVSCSVHGVVLYHRMSELVVLSFTSEPCIESVVLGAQGGVVSFAWLISSGFVSV